MPFVAGQKVRASQLNSGQPIMAYVASDVTIISSTSPTNITGLVAALEANALYAWDAFIAYTANETGDAKIGFTVPTGTTGVWGAFPIAASENIANTRGIVEGFRVDGYGDANTQGISGADDLSGAMICCPRGYIDTASTAGNFQGRFAQLVSNANNTSIKAGSWLRVVRLA